MYLQSLSILNFKNIEQIELEFSPVVNCFLGNNGEGKTNLLDAIYYLSYTKSFFNAIDYQNVRFDQEYFMIQGDFNHNDEISNIYCGLKKAEKKIFKKNKKVYTKLADHVGLFPVVMITPYDSNLILEGSDIRRKFLDAMIAQFDRNYLNLLIHYNKVVQQRNALLKQFAERGNFQESLLDIYDDQLVEKATLIHQNRSTFIKEFVPVFNAFYQQISSGKEGVSLGYESQLNNQEDIKKLLKSCQTNDLKATYCTLGIHKDDLEFRLGANPLKKFGSQGQQKSFLIALKLAQFEFIKSKRGFAPILLLDDIFDKLDDTRVSYLLKLIAEGKLGQTFITDTSAKKVPELLVSLNVPHQTFEIEKGALKT
jgi:DNA replication and repair protein RecF